MFNLVLLTELGRQRQRDVARDVALCHRARSPRIVLGRTLVALGAFVVFIGAALDEESERNPEVRVA
jgi:hypothetical protein